MNKMTRQERADYEAMSNPQRARWLLEGGVTAKVGIDPKTLSLRWLAYSRGRIQLPAVYSRDGEAETIAAAVASLTEIMAGVPDAS